MPTSSPQVKPSPRLFPESASVSRYPVHALEFDKRDVAHVQIPLSAEAVLESEYDDIPEGFALVGGAARSIAFQAIKGVEFMPVRDVDIVVLRDDISDGNYTSIYEALPRLEEKYMRDDAAFGHGIRFEDSGRYFSSRDFTINQVAVVRRADGWDLEMTRQAIIDTEKTTIRPTIAVHDIRDDVLIPPKLAIKAILLEQVLSAQGLSPRIQSIDIARYGREVDRGGLFYLGLGLQKAFEWGGEIPQEFIRALRRYGFINSDVRTARDLADLVMEYTDFAFRGPAIELLSRPEIILGPRPLTQKIGEVCGVLTEIDRR